MMVALLRHIFGPSCTDHYDDGHLDLNRPVSRFLGRYSCQNPKHGSEYQVLPNIKYPGMRSARLLHLLDV